jgi:hypothetical protein
MEGEAVARTEKASGVGLQQVAQPENDSQPHCSF